MHIYVYNRWLNKAYFSLKKQLNAKELFGSDLTLKTPLRSHLPQQSSSLHNLPDPTTKNSTIEFDCKVSKEQISQSI